jgi:hypothetical protein
VVAEVETKAVEPKVVAEVETKAVEPKVVETRVAISSKPVTQGSTQVKGTSDLVRASAGFADEAAEQGFEDLELSGVGIFPIVVIGTGGCFEVDGEEVDFVKLDCRLETTKALYMCVQKGVQDGPAAYTYDKINLNSELDGSLTVADLRAAWEEEGEEMEIKRYLEVLIEVVDDSSGYQNEFFVMKVAPASVNSFKRIPFMANRRGRPLNEVVVEFSIGARREAKNGKKYTPWAFKDITNQYA